MDERTPLLAGPMPAEEEESEAQAPLVAAVRLTPTQKKRSVMVMCVIWFFTGVEYAVILPTIWAYLQENGADHKYWLSITVSAFSVANFLLSPIFGRAADLYSTKTVR